VDYFFGVVMGSQLDNRSLYAIAQFLSTEIVQKHDSQLLDKRNSGVLDSSSSMKSPTRVEIPTGGFRDGSGPSKEGYLTKRGKNFGGWQTRYFVLDGPQLKYYDAV
jgi:RalA-binding protein 1